MAQEESFLSKMNKYRKEIITGLLIILLIVFMVQNSHDVDFYLVFTDMHVPLIVLILAFAALGASIVGVYWMMSSRDKKRTIKEMGSQIGSLEKMMEEWKKGQKPKEGE